MSHCDREKHKHQQSSFPNEQNKNFRNRMSFVFWIEKLLYFGYQWDEMDRRYQEIDKVGIILDTKYSMRHDHEWKRPDGECKKKKVMDENQCI